MNVLGQIAKNIVIKDDLRAEVTEVLLPVYARLDALYVKSERILQGTTNLHERSMKVETVGVSPAVDDRLMKRESQIAAMHR